MGMGLLGHCRFVFGEEKMTSLRWVCGDLDQFGRFVLGFVGFEGPS